MKQLITLLSLLNIFAASAIDQGLIHKAGYNPNRLSTSSSQSWKFTVSYTTNNSSCTGFFITHTKMITAAHCFENNDSVRYVQFYQGSTYSHYVSPADHNITFNIRRHRSRDLAVVDFSESPANAAGFYDLQPAVTVSRHHLNYFDELKGRSLFIIGAGINNTGQRDFLGFVKGRYIAQYGNEVRYRSGNQGTCAGDSGGPVTISDSIDGLVVVGVTVSSHRNINKNCGNDSYFEVFDEEAADWIWQ